VTRLWRPRLPRLRRGAPRRPPQPVRPGVLGRSRVAALVAIAALVATASLVSFAESYRALYDWASRHSLHGLWAVIWPLQVDVFIAVGELALFVGLAYAWDRRSRAGAWLVTLAGLTVSVAGNVGHVTGHALADRATAAVPPLAAASALAVGLGVLKRVVQAHDGDAISAPPWTDAETAAAEALRRTAGAGNPLSANQLQTQFRLTRAEATKVRQAVLAAANGQAPE
jgi:uncharacterized protein DUF2637